MNIYQFKTAGLNLTFRFLTLGAKLVFSLFLIKYIATEEFGVYGYIAKTLAIAILFLGLDFYTFSSRDILQGNAELQGKKIKDQFVFYGITYILFAPLMLFVFVFDIIAWQYVFWVYALLILDHFSQELYRILLMYKHSVIASALFFIKAGLWIFPLFLVFWFGNNNLKSLDTVLYLWTFFTFVSILFGLYFFKKLPFKIDITENIDWHWLEQGIFISLPFFIGTLASSIVEFADAYMLKAYFPNEGTTMYGIYSFFVGMGNIVQMFVQSAILIVFAPKLIESFSQDKAKYKRLHSEMAKQTIFASVGIAVLVFVLLYPLLQFIGKTELIAHYHLIYYLVGAKVVFNLSMIYHYHLYVSRNDRSIIITMLIAAVVNILLNMVLIPKYDILGAAIATLISFCVILVLKYMFSKQINIDV